MAGYNYQAGRSNNMVDAEARGMITIGRWAKRHGVSARAAVEVMQPSEAHHTGTGRRGKSRLTAVIEVACEPTAAQLIEMRSWDRGQRPTVRGWYIKWLRDYSGPYGRRRNVPTLGLYEGDPAKAPNGFRPIGEDPDWATAKALEGRTLRPYATRFDQVM